MKKISLALCLIAPLGCAAGTSYVHADATTLGRVVVYRNGVAYFERYAEVSDDALHLSVPADKVDDFLKSLTVVDATTGSPAPIAYPTDVPTSGTGTIDMKIALQGARPHRLRLSYVTEAPSWKPSYRVNLAQGGKVGLQAWAIVDNTSGEDWKQVKLAVGASSAMSFRYDLRSVRLVERETLRQTDLFAQAPPTGGATYGAGTPEAKGGKRMMVDLADDVIARGRDEERATEVAAGRHAYKTPAPAGQPGAQGATGAGYGAGTLGGLSAPRKEASKPASAAIAPNVTADGRPAAAGPPPPPDPLASVARQAQVSSNKIVIEGFATGKDGDKNAASLDRANRVREQLLRQGVDPSRVVAVGRGEVAGRSGGVRIVEEPPEPKADAAKKGETEKGKEAQAAAAEPTEPIGTSHFESGAPMTIPRGSSAMISILDAPTDGEVVYLYDPDSPRGNAQFPFRTVRLRNPTDSALETGPVSVFGDGRFIGEGMTEPIPARSIAFIPFALDRQVIVERKDAERDEIAKILTVQRGVFSTQVRHIRRAVFTLYSRLPEKAVVYLRHAPRPGYKLAKSPAGDEKIGGAHLFRVEIDPGGKVEVPIEEHTEIFKTTDVRAPGAMDLVRVHLSHAAESALKAKVDDLVKLQQEIGNLEQRIQTAREQMQEYRARMDELHAQIVTLKAVRTAGPLMANLEKKLQEVSDRLSKATIDLVGLQEKLMIARIHFQDGVADLSLEAKPEAKSEPKGDAAKKPAAPGSKPEPAAPAKPEEAPKKPEPAAPAKPK